MWRGRLLASGVVALVALGCSSGGDSAGPGRAGLSDPTVDAGSTAAPPLTLAGGLTLAAVDAASVLVGDDLAFGAALPSEVAAAETFADDGEVAQVALRRVYVSSNARHLGRALILRLDGRAFFDEAALAGWERGLVEGLADGAAGRITAAGAPALLASGPGAAVAGFREGDLVVALIAASPQDATVAAERMRAGLRRGDPPRPELATPMRRPAPADVFVAVESVSFVPFPPADEEAAPPPPSLAGAVAAEGRIAEVGGERRATVWSLATDGGVYPTAEALQGALEGFASSRSGGAPASSAEVLDRVVAASDGAGEGSARAFRHGSLVLLVEGADPADLDAIVSAWITALGPP